MALTSAVIEEAQAKVDLRERARKDKLFLATEVLGYDFQPDVHTELFDQYIPFKDDLTYFAQSNIKDRLILWQRGIYKTTSITVEIIQTILNNPDVRIVIMQGTVKNTQEWLSEIKSHFMGDAPKSRLKELFPEFCSGVQGKVHKGNKSEWTTPARTRKELRQATITVASPKSVKAGKHFDVGFFDDLVNDQNYRSPQQLVNVAKMFRLCIPLIDPGGYRYVTGTRYAFGDLYEEIVRTAGQNWILSITDCWLPGKAFKEPRFKQRTLKDGRLVGFTLEMLLQIQRDDPEMFACQYMNQPIHGPTQIFTEQMVKGCLLSNKDPKVLGFHRSLGLPETVFLPLADIYRLLGPSVLFIDLAASATGRRDHSVIMCGKVDTIGTSYLVDVRGDKFDPEQLAMNVIDMALRHRPVKIMIEGTAAGKYAVQYITEVARLKGLYLPFDLIPVNNQKDAKNFRISAIAGTIRNGKLVIFDNLPRWDMILEQFVRFDLKKDSHDDYPDTIGLMIQHFQKNTLPQQRPRHPIFELITKQEEFNKIVLREPESDFQGLGSDFGC